MNKSKKISLSLNKKKIASFTTNAINGGGDTKKPGVSGACASSFALECFFACDTAPGHCASLDC